MDRNKLYEAWKGFNEGKWMEEIDVRDFIISNYTAYEQGYDFLEGATEDTKHLWDEVKKLLKQELIEVETGIIKLSNKGIDLANLVWEEFV